LARARKSDACSLLCKRKPVNCAYPRDVIPARTSRLAIIARCDIELTATPTFKLTCSLTIVNASCGRRNDDPDQLHQVKRVYIERLRLTTLCHPQPDKLKLSAALA
jgi:hypothetical protein